MDRAHLESLHWLDLQKLARLHSCTSKKKADIINELMEITDMESVLTEATIAAIDKALLKAEDYSIRDNDWFVKGHQNVTSEIVTVTLYELYTLLKQRGEDGQFSVNPSKVKALLTGSLSLVSNDLIQDIVVGVYQDHKLLVGGGHRTTAIIELLSRKLAIVDNLSDKSLTTAMKNTNVRVIQKTFPTKSALYASILTDNGSRSKTKAETQSVSSIMKLGLNINNLDDLRLALTTNQLKVSGYVYKLYNGAPLKARDQDGNEHQLSENSTMELFKKVFNTMLDKKTGLVMNVTKADEHGNDTGVDTGAVYNFTEALIKGKRYDYSLTPELAANYLDLYPGLEYEESTGRYVWTVPNMLDELIQLVGYTAYQTLMKDEYMGINVTRFNESTMMETLIKDVYASILESDSDFIEYLLPPRRAK